MDLMHDLVRWYMETVTIQDSFYCIYGVLGVVTLGTFGSACYIYYKEAKESKQREQMREQSDLEKKIHKDTII